MVPRAAVANELGLQDQHANMMPASQSEIDKLYTIARAQYAYFDPSRGNAVFMENAGGSQVLSAASCRHAHS